MTNEHDRKTPEQAVSMQPRLENESVSLINRLVRHSRRVLPQLEDIVLLAQSEETTSGLIVGYLSNGEERIPVPLGVVDPEGSVWSMLATSSMTISGRDAVYTEPLAIPIRVPEPQQGQ